MREHLFSIESKLHEMPVFATGRPADDDKADEQEAQLGMIEEQLKLISRDLNSSAHLAELLIKNARKTPLECRWSVRESAGQRSRNVGLLIAQAERLSALVRDLLKKNGLLSPMQVGKDLIELIEELQTQLHSHTKTSYEQPSKQVAISKQVDARELHLESIGPLITFAIVGIKYWKKRVAKKNSRVPEAAPETLSSLTKDPDHFSRTCSAISGWISCLVPLKLPPCRRVPSSFEASAGLAASSLQSPPLPASG